MAFLPKTPVLPVASIEPRELLLYGNDRSAPAVERTGVSAFPPEALGFEQVAGTHELEWNEPTVAEWTVLLS
jgi:hypothetical protein